MKRKYIIPIFIPHQGCPHSCVFCNQRIITGQDKGIDTERVEKEIEWYISRFPKNQCMDIAFYGGSFTCIPHAYQKAYLSIAKKYKDKNIVDGIRLSTRPDCITHDIMKHLIQYGVDTIELGVQSLDCKVLEAAERGHTEKDVYDAVQCIRMYPMALGLQMMVGLPGEKAKSAIETALGISRLKPDFVRVYPTIVLQHTSLDQMYREGKYIPLTLEKAVTICANIKMIFEFFQIPVARMGLQSSNEISPDSDLVTAGPLHPAFGELVENRIWLYLLTNGLANIASQENKMIDKIEVQFHPRNYSKIIGNQKNNQNTIRQRYSKLKVIFRQNPSISIDEIRIIANGVERKFARNQLFSEKIEGILSHI